jgi:hypothetical protein
VGWEDREWAKWTDEQHDAYLDGRAPRPQITGKELVERLDSPYSGGISLRVKVWGRLAGGIAVIATGIVYLVATAPVPVTGVSTWRPWVLYGWQHVPPVHAGYVDPSRIGNTLAGKPILCTRREPDDLSRWVCTEYTYVNGRPVVVLPPDSPLRSVACNTDPSVRCPVPGTTI